MWRALLPCASASSGSKRRERGDSRTTCAACASAGRERSPAAAGAGGLERSGDAARSSESCERPSKLRAALAGVSGDALRSGTFALGDDGRAAPPAVPGRCFVPPGAPGACAVSVGGGAPAPPRPSRAARASMASSSAIRSSCGGSVYSAGGGHGRIAARGAELSRDCCSAQIRSVLWPEDAAHKDGQRRQGSERACSWVTRAAKLLRSAAMRAATSSGGEPSPPAATGSGPGLSSSAVTFSFVSDPLCARSGAEEWPAPSAAPLPERLGLGGARSCVPGPSEPTAFTAIVEALRRVEAGRSSLDMGLTRILSLLSSNDPSSFRRESST